ncbi:MAG: response regulator [Spirulina sp. SIO3F2]|nr:response regulator [Spirulina sp. SIO3F2]
MATNKLAIVCVDDEPTILQSLKLELEEALGADCLVELAQGGEEALEVLEELQAEAYQVAVVIADYIMPGLKGDELLIQVHSQDPRILKIMLTGQADAQAVGNAVNDANLYRYIAKPWDEMDLILTVKEAIRSFSQDEQLETQNETLQQLNAYLEQKIEERTHKLSAANVQLQRLNEELQRSNTALEEFAYAVSHDLQQPLQSIIGFGKLLQLQYSSALGEKGAGQLQRLLAAADRMGQMLRGLLTYARVGQQYQDLSPVDCNAVIEQVQANLQEAIAQAQAQIIINPLPALTANETQLIQLFQNLLSNALKFARADVPPIIEIQAQQLKRVWTFRVQDNGCGIPEAERDRVFELFHRRQATAEQPGTGIGLATCKKIVECYSGRIWVEGAVEGGAVFCFTLPAYPPRRGS